MMSSCNIICNSRRQESHWYDTALYSVANSLDSLPGLLYNATKDKLLNGLKQVAVEDCLASLGQGLAGE